MNSSITAQKILTFDFHTLTVGNEVTATSYFNDVNLDTSIILRGAGITFLDEDWVSENGTLDPGLFNSYKWNTNNFDPDDYLEFTISPKTGYQFAVSSIIIEHERNGAGPTNFVLRTSADGFSSNIGGIFTIPEVQATPVITTVSFPSLIAMNTALTVRLYAYDGTSANGTWGVGIGGDIVGFRDNIIVNGFVTPEDSPSIFISKTALNDFYYMEGPGTSETQSFTLIGNNLTGDLTVTGSTNYEVSLDSSNFFPSLLVNNTGGNVLSTPIFVRLKSGLTVADYNEIVTVTGGGASQRQINCTGFVSPYNLVINEILSDAYPDGSIDSNNDGVSDYVEDQFIELVNFGIVDINLTNFTIKVFHPFTQSTTTSHTFISGTILPVNEAIVVFGGGSLANFSNSQAQIATRPTQPTVHNLRLSEAGGKVTISDNLNRRIAVYTYGNEGAQDQSLARNPDFTGPFVKHLSITTNSVIFSPGRKNTDNEPLPVELSSFSAMVSESGVKLEWRTETEVNNYGFEVERKSNVKGQSSEVWEQIGFVDGNGNSNSPKDYTFEDNNVTTSKYAYRLKQIDNDGEYNYSKIVEVDLSIPIKFELSQNYPNPFNPTTTIKFSLPQAGFVKLTIFNLLGEEVTTLVNENREAGIHTFNFNASEFNSGLYIYRIESNGNAQTKKMMLLK
jgi:hypothetical protein